MCGIAGFAGSDRNVITKMTDALVHRGPDGNAIWSDDRASLGHCRLAILDPRPEGDQPMWNDDRTVAIVFNGEIYNYRELREREGLTCRTNTDTEVILKLYEKHGTAFIRNLRGMFAFGIYDTRDGSWHLARDHKGIKPLFVAYPEGRLAFASEMRSLMGAFTTKPALNMTALSLYMRLQYVPGPMTLCEGIEQLPPGTILSRRGGQETRTRFSPDETHAPFRSRAEFMEAFPAIMDETVKSHLISDKPVGLFLSGGMDSSILLHHMSAHAAKPIKTFTVRFDATKEEGGERFNTDADLARTTARHYGTDHHEVFLSAELERDLYRETAQALDQPNGNSIAVAQYLLARETKKHVDVALSGIGGDELFGGYPRYRIASILRTFRAIPPMMRQGVGAMFSYPPDVLELSPGPMLAERLLARTASEGISITKGAWFDPLATTLLFTERYAQEEMCHPERSRGAIRSFMEFDRHLWMVDEALRLADGTTMGSGLEGRVPFVDEHVIAAAHATPASWHVGLKGTKTLLKETYRGMLPPHLFELKKSSFYPPLAKWLRRECSVLADEMLAHPRIAEFFDVEKLRVMVDEHRKHKVYHLHILSSLIQLSHWFDVVYDA